VLMKFLLEARDGEAGVSAWTDIGLLPVFVVVCMWVRWWCGAQEADR